MRGLCWLVMKANLSKFRQRQTASCVRVFKVKQKLTFKTASFASAAIFPHSSPIVLKVAETDEEEPDGFLTLSALLVEHMLDVTIDGDVHDKGSVGIHFFRSAAEGIESGKVRFGLCLPEFDLACIELQSDESFSALAFCGESMLCCAAVDIFVFRTV
jgi:hypothetical protein